MNHPDLMKPYLPPEVIERACGGWLAYSQERSPVRIGVVGQTEVEARERFRQSIDRWNENLQAAGA